MEMQHSDVGEVRKIVLAGRLDTAGVDQVETKFGAAIVPAGKNTIVDLSRRQLPGLDGHPHADRHHPIACRARAASW